MSFLAKSYVEVRCDIAADQNCRVSFAAPNNDTAEIEALAMGWVKRGWKHYCPECLRRQAIERQKSRVKP